MQSHAPQHDDARHSVRGPLRIVARLRVVGRHGFRRDFEREILRPRKFFEIFSPKSAANRTKSDAPQRADALHSVCGPPRIVARLRVVGRHDFWRDPAGFRTWNSAAAKIFRKFRSEIRCKSHKISRAAACRRSAQCLGTSLARGKAAHRRAARISARSCAIFLRPRKIFENFGPNFSEIR